MPLDLKELRELLTALNQTDISELTLKSNDFELTVRRGVQAEPTMPFQPSSTVVAPPIAPLPDVARPEPAGAPAPLSAPPPSNDRRFVEITSPMVGTFYRAPGPDESPFVQVGDRIRSGQTVCIIEAMKLMNELEAEVSGEVIEILVQNGDPVEFGQPLIRVNPG